MTNPVDRESDAAQVQERRAAVLDAALGTFARFGYRKTSMDDVARDARISRPGLYFMFSSKAGLFRAASERGIELDLAAAENALVDLGRPLRERVVEAFDRWAGRYVGPLRGVSALVEEAPDLVGPIAVAGPVRFASLLAAAVRTADVVDAEAVVRTLVSVSVGLKHQADDRDAYRAGMTDAVRLLIPADPSRGSLLHR